jgi:hypothetical protein
MSMTERFGQSIVKLELCCICGRVILKLVSRIQSSLGT